MAHIRQSRFSGIRFVFILFFLPVCGWSQGYYFYDFGHYEPTVVLDVGIHAGIMNSITDIGGNKNGSKGIGALTTRSSQLGFGAAFTATYKDILALRLELNSGRVAQYDSTLADATSPTAKGRYERNLHFRSSIFDMGLLLEFHPILLRNYTINDRYFPRLSPYVCFGVGATFFNPQAQYQGRWIDLAPLRLEGQGFDEYPDRQPYSKTMIALPVGFGFRYEVSRTLFLRAEFLHRFTNSDYLDDVSEKNWVDPSLFNKYLQPNQAAIARQLYNRSTTINPPRNTRPRGNPGETDTYWSAVLKIGICINRSR